MVNILFGIIPFYILQKISYCMINILFSMIPLYMYIMLRISYCGQYIVRYCTIEYTGENIILLRSIYCSV